MVPGYAPRTRARVPSLHADLNNERLSPRLFDAGMPEVEASPDCATGRIVIHAGISFHRSHSDWSSHRSNLTVIVFEVIKVWLASELSVRDALLGATEPEKLP